MIGVPLQLARSERPVKALVPPGGVALVTDAVKLNLPIRGQVRSVLSMPLDRPWATERAASDGSACGPVRLPELRLEGVSAMPTTGSSASASSSATGSAAASFVHPTNGSEARAVARVRAAAASAVSSPGVSGIEATAARRWHRVLSFMVGDEAATAPPRDVLRFLLVSGLLLPADSAGSAAFREQLEELRQAKGRVERSDNDDASGFGAMARVRRARRVHLSPRGYRFLLADTEHQLWTIIRHYAQVASSPSSEVEADAAPETAPERAGSGAVVRLLMRLGHCHLGDAVALAALSESELRVLSDLEVLGIVVGEGPRPAARRARIAAAREAAAIAAEAGEGGATGTIEAANAEAARVAALALSVESSTTAKNDRFFVSSLAIVLLSPEAAESAAEAQAVTSSDGGSRGSSGTGDLDTTGGSASRAGKSPSQLKLTSHGWTGGLEGRARSHKVASGAHVADIGAVSGIVSTDPAAQVGVGISTERNFRIYAMTTESIHAHLLGEWFARGLPLAGPATASQSCGWCPAGT